MGNNKSRLRSKQRVFKEIFVIKKAILSFKNSKVKKLKKREYSVIDMMRHTKVPIAEVMAKAAVNVKYVKYVQASTLLGEYLDKMRKMGVSHDRESVEYQVDFLPKMRGVMWALERLDLVERFRFKRVIVEMLGDTVMVFGPMGQKIPLEVSLFKLKCVENVGVKKIDFRGILIFDEIYENWGG